jgi:hypothetical protein
MTSVMNLVLRFGNSRVLTGLARTNIASAKTVAAR